MKNRDGEDVLEQAAAWFFRQEDTPLSPQEQAHFRAWIAASEEHRAAYAEISGTWHELGGLPHPVGLSHSPPPARGGLFRPLSASLAFCLLLAGGAWHLDIATRLRADNYTVVGELQTVDLADGSHIELNSDSAVAIAYSGHERRIRLLKGEATFTVSADPARPFVVEAQGGEATALGTVYGVRDAGERVTVTVIESRVAVTAGAGETPTQLRQDQRIQYGNGQIGAIEQVDAAAETAWRRKKLIFVDRPLGEVVDELNRYHKGVIRIVDGSIRAKRVSGVFETGNIVGVIDALEKSFGFNDTRLGNFLILIHR